MKFVRMYTGPDGRSHFEDLPMAYDPAKHPPYGIPLKPVSGAFFRRGIKSLNKFQRAPRRHYVITLAGEIEIEVGSGDTRRFGPGDVLLAEDTTGEGHIVRVIGGEERVALSLPIVGE